MPTPTVRDLRRLWKPHKERLQDQQSDHPTTVRFHRACSWLQHVEKQTDRIDFDTALLHQWIAFNALYGQWNTEERGPQPDRASYRGFLDRILKLDANEQIGSILKEHRPLVMSILDDEHLSRYFWEEPTPQRAGKSRKAKFDAQTWYIQRNWTMILDRLVERIYLLRCQLVHGAATCGSKLNRDALRRSSTMLGHLLPAMLMVFAEDGADEDWGVMYYPPLK